MSVKIRLNSREMAGLLKSEQVRGPLHDIAERVAGSARSDAPVDTGAYRASIRVDSDTTDRAVERVVADVRHATTVESRRGTLKRALGGA